MFGIFIYFIYWQRPRKLGRSRASISSQANHRSYSCCLVMNIQTDRLSNTMCAVCIPPKCHAIPFDRHKTGSRSVAGASSHAVVLVALSLWELWKLLVCFGAIGVWWGEHTWDSWMVPFSMICLMTSSSTWVPNSLSRVECDAAFISPWAPCLVILSVWLISIWKCSTV